MVFRASYFIVTLTLLVFISAPVLGQGTSEYSHVRVRIQKNLTQYPKNLPAKFGQHNRKYEIIHKENAKFDVVEVVPLTHYLAGVVSKEMPLAWPAEALKAQAVVARSYLMTRMNERHDKLFDVENDQMDQVFEWTNSAKAYQVVQSTEDVILSLNKKVVKTFYHSDCGGQTVPADKVWTGAVDLGTAKDTWCATRPNNQWSFAVSTSEFNTESVLNDKESFATEYFKNKLVLFETWGIQRLRQVFGFSKIRSSPDTVDVNNNVVTFSGRGFGHGVGLCQWGSLYMAKKGRTYMDILTHYYPKAEILKIQSLLIKNYLTNNEIPKTINKTGIIYNN